MNDLAERCREILEWHSTGLLHGGSGGALRTLADSLKPKVGDHYALSVAEKQTADEAMRAVVELASKSAAEADVRADFLRRCQAYLDDCPSDGGHSDAAGSTAYELIAEGIALGKHEGDGR